MISVVGDQQAPNFTSVLKMNLTLDNYDGTSLQLSTFLSSLVYRPCTFAILP
jgi:hypothetical protein